MTRANKNNRLEDENIENIVKGVEERIEKQYFTHIASYDEVKDNNFDLTVENYVEQEDTTPVIDIKELNKEIEAIVIKEQKLRDEINKIIADIEGGDLSE